MLYKKVLLIELCEKAVDSGLWGRGSYSSYACIVREMESSTGKH
jgi:hypothetical protein